MLFTKSTLRLVFVVRAIHNTIQAFMLFMAKLNYFRTRFCESGAFARSTFNFGITNHGALIWQERLNPLVRK